MSGSRRLDEMTRSCPAVLLVLVWPWHSGSKENSVSIRKSCGGGGRKGGGDFPAGSSTGREIIVRALQRTKPGSGKGVAVKMLFESARGEGMWRGNEE